jgi:ABC-2 type transport system ATP-binding protein
MMKDTVLVTKDLTKRYGSTAAVNHVNMTIGKGQIYGLVGRNGAGKTTIIRMVAAQNVASSGEIWLFGGHTSAELSAARARIGAMVEIPSFYPYLNARQNLEYYRIQRGIPGKHCVDEVLELVDLAHTGKKTFKAFSLGMKQRLGLALALMNHPDFLLLDEPINGLDPEGIVEFRNLLLKLNQEHGTTILLSSHILSELSNIATHYGFLDKGNLLEETSAKALHEKCRACLQLTVDDAGKAVITLERQLNLHDYEVLPGNVLRVFDYLNRPQDVTAALIQQGVAIFGVESKGSNLEDYFLTLIGGDKHA